MSKAFKVFDASKTDGKDWEITQDNSDRKKYSINFRSFIPTVSIAADDVDFLVSPIDTQHPLIAEYVPDDKLGFVSFFISGGSEGVYKLAIKVVADDVVDERTISVHVTNSGLFQPVSSGF